MKTVDFSETIEACDLKVGQLIDFMKVCEFLKVKLISLPCIFQVLYVLCFTGTRYHWHKISGERLQDHWSSGLYLAFNFYV